MSGLGIDFSDACQPDSPLYRWEADLPSHPSFTIGDISPRPSRWSASTQQTTRAAKCTSTGDLSTSKSQSQVSSHRRHSSTISQVIPPPSTIIRSKRPSEAEVQAFLDGRVSQRSARESDGSHNSIGPLTPQDDVSPCAGLITIAGIPNFGESPRKAPEPPTQTGQCVAGSTSKLSRRPSLTQSMLRTLNGRKKDTKPPPSADLIPVSTLPARYELAPIVHRLDRPVARRTESTTGSYTAVSPTIATAGESSPRVQCSDDGTPSRKGIGTLLRSVRKSISRRASKASPSLESRSMMSVLYPSAGSAKSNAPSFVNVQIETSSETGSTSAFSASDRKGALHMINPASQAAAIACRPRTAPVEARKEKIFRLQMMPLSQETTSSSSGSSSPIAGQDTRLGGFKIQYAGSWKKGSAFEPASAYSASPSAPPSPLSSPLTHQLEVSRPLKRYGQDSMDDQRVDSPKKNSQSTFIPNAAYSSCSNASASPTSVPSWTPMVALPSPNVSILAETPPPVSFLDLGTSHPPFSKATTSRSGTAIVSRKQRPLGAQATPFLLTPGKVSMRDPWAKAPRPCGSSKDVKDANEDKKGFQLSHPIPSLEVTEQGHLIGLPPSPITASPGLRRLSRKSVPKIDEETVHIAFIEDKEHDEANRIYTGCRPFHRQSLDQQLSDANIKKGMFKARASLGDVTQGLVDGSVLTLPRSQSHAGRGEAAYPSVTSDDGEAWYDRVGRPSYPTFENTYSFRRPSYASESSSQSFPSKPTKVEFRRPSALAQGGGMRVSFDTDRRPMAFSELT